jgi:HTH-type transcriptional regulator/antitoxin HigA
LSGRAVTKRTQHDDQDVYLRLIQEFPLRPIRNDRELARASEVADRLSIRDELEPAEQDYLDVLDDLIARYERERHAISPLPDADLLRELIAVRGVTQQHVAQATGIVYSTISSVLAGRRKLTRDQIGRLARYFHVDPGSFSFAAAEREETDRRL